MILGSFLEKKIIPLLNFNFISNYIVKLFRHNKNYIVAFIDSPIIHNLTPLNLNYALSLFIRFDYSNYYRTFFIDALYTPRIDLAFSFVE
jgi:riboflavin transporter FmnP